MADNPVFTIANNAPTVSPCGGDVPQFAADLQAFIVRGFSQVYAAMAQKERAAHDLCRDLGLLAPDDCLITEAGIDQTTFTYAASASEVIEPGSGVLPYVDSPDVTWYRAGAKIQPTDSNVNYLIYPPIPDNVGVNFIVNLSQGNDVRAYLVAPSEERRNAGSEDYFGVNIVPDDEEPSMWFYWLILPFD